MFPILLALLSGQSAPSADLSTEIWPQTPPGKIVATPDWSDYRIYPRAALLKEEEGLVVAELLIGADGKPEACRIVQSSSFAELDNGTCGLMMSMRFEPARDPSGKPIPSHFRRAVSWGLTDPRPFASSAIRVRASIADRKLRACDVIGGEGPYVAYWSGFACGVIADVPYYFGDRSAETLNAIVEIRLDARDNAPFLGDPWISGKAISHEKIAFRINGEGDASECTRIEGNMGPRGLNNLSPCGRMLSGLWFSPAPTGTPSRTGTFETHVTEVDSEGQP